MKENERNHREYRGKLDSLCSQKEFPLKDITEKIIGCAIEVHSTLWPGLLINFNVERLKDGIKRLILIEATEGGGRVKSSKLLTLKKFSVFSVVNI